MLATNSWDAIEISDPPLCTVIFSSAATLLSMKLPDSPESMRTSTSFPFIFALINAWLRHSGAVATTKAKRSCPHWFRGYDRIRLKSTQPLYWP